MNLQVPHVLRVYDSMEAQEAKLKDERKRGKTPALEKNTSACKTKNKHAYDVF